MDINCVTISVFQTESEEQIVGIEGSSFTISQQSQQIAINYQERKNPHERFLQERTTADAEGVIASRELYTAYKEWLAETEPARTPLSESKFVHVVQRTYPHAEKSRVRINDGPSRRAAWHGITYTVEPHV